MGTETQSTNENLSGILSSPGSLDGNLSGGGNLSGNLSVDGGAGDDSLTGILSAAENLSGSLSSPGSLDGNLSGDGSLSGSMATPNGGDYNRNIHKPSINSVELKGNKTSHDLGIPTIHYGTTEEWNSHIEIVSECQAIYLYTDYKVDSGVDLPGIKIGDGTSYLIDLPFITANTAGVEHMIENHVSNSSVHVSPEDREFWNSKHKAIVSGNETLVFTEL